MTNTLDKVADQLGFIDQRMGELNDTLHSIDSDLMGIEQAFDDLNEGLQLISAKLDVILKDNKC